MSLQSNIINWGSNTWDKVQSVLSNEFVMKETTGHFNVAAPHCACHKWWLFPSMAYFIY